MRKAEGDRAVKSTARKLQHKGDTHHSADNAEATKANYALVQEFAEQFNRLQAALASAEKIFLLRLTVT